MLALDALIMVGLVNDALFACKVNKSCDDNSISIFLFKKINTASNVGTKIL